MTIMKYWLLGCILVYYIVGCSPAKRLSQELRQNQAYTDHFTGFALYDPGTNKMLVQHNAEKHFTPASNTKLFSFYAGLMTLGDSLPALRYITRHDSLIMWGTGNPLLLNPDLPDTAVLHFLRNRPEKLFLSVSNFAGERFGPGWSWDDYNDYYSPEVTPFPIYGNIVRYTATGNQRVVQPYQFADSTIAASGGTAQSVHRAEWSNRFTASIAVKPDEQDVPFRWSPELAARLLADTLHKPVHIIARQPGLRPNQTVYGHLLADSLYKRMLVVSDNLLAEHLMLLCAATDDTLTSSLAIKQAIATNLADLPDATKWVDGSGLSRYNLFTPRSIVGLLRKIRAKVPQHRLFALLPSNGSGTLGSLSKQEPAFVWAKSGSMTGVYNLSGYLLTRRGKVLLFSMMHNNFTGSISDMRQRTATFLNQVRNAY